MSTFGSKADIAYCSANVRFCGADMGILRRRVGEVYELAATYGVKSEWGKVIAHHPNLPGRHSIMARAAASGQTVQVADVLQDPEYVNTATQKLIGLFTAPGFGDWFRERCNEAGYPRIVPLAACGRPPAGAWPEAGCSANVIASISGHTTLHPEVARYTKAADQERMARDGTAAKSRTETGNGQKSVANSGEKP